MAKHILIKRKSDGAPLLSVPENTTYKLPAGYQLKDLTMEVWNDTPPPISIPEIASPPCKKCGQPTFHQGSCCAERAAGFIGKWVCRACHFIAYEKRV